MGDQEDDYGVSARDYLFRAREKLLEGSKTALFHAALELRCCVEARQAEYLEGQTGTSKKLQPFRLGETARTIRRIYAGELIFKMTISSTQKDAPSTTHYHTPVPQVLLSYCERRIDALRHAQTHYRPPKDVWWDEIRREMVEHYRLAWLACQGTILMPPLWDRKTGRLSPIRIQLGTDRMSSDQIGRPLEAVGTTLMMRVEHLEHPPPDWHCDLRLWEG